MDENTENSEVASEVATVETTAPAEPATETPTEGTAPTEELG